MLTLRLARNKLQIKVAARCAESGNANAENTHIIQVATPSHRVASDCCEFLQLSYPALKMGAISFDI